MSDTRVYLFYGTDEFAITKRVDEFHKAMGDPTTADMNTTRLDARSMTDDGLNNAVNAMPFLAAKRLVIVSNPSSRYDKTAAQKKFIEFLNLVPGSAILVLIEAGTLKDTHWLVKWAKAAGETVEYKAFNMPKMREMPGWISAETLRQGGKMEPQAAARLAEMVGEDTRVAAQEITKLLTYVNYAHAIGLEDVEAVSIVTAQGDVFEMVDALGTGNGKRALASLHKLLETEEPFSLFGMVVRQFRLLLQAREVLDGGGNVQVVLMEVLHLPPFMQFVAEKLAGQARGFKLDTLEAIYRRLLRLDEAVKTGQMTLDTGLEMFVVELTKKG